MAAVYIDEVSDAAFLSLKDFLNERAIDFNTPKFITDDPVCIPHQFTLKQDIEIAGFFAAILAWGQRKTIINKTKELVERMGNEPYNFVRNHSDQDLKGLLGFKHRTFNDTDLLYFIEFFRHHYASNDSLEQAFMPANAVFNPDYLAEGIIGTELTSAPCYAGTNSFTTEQSLNYFRSYFFSLDDFPGRTVKHISSPAQGSTCKRLNMFLRWMVRKDTKGVDLGIWSHIKPSALICPCDVHVDRVGRELGLIKRKQTDWLTAVELTINLRKFDPADPVKYDFALFGMGVGGGRLEGRG
ncbi:MAG: TIGR02757 family protein [Pedobacter sp.]|nr:MAG: TIGR02757 family protein [Pedobacter sp.]